MTDILFCILLRHVFSDNVLLLFFADDPPELKPDIEELKSTKEEERSVVNDFSSLDEGM